MLTFIRFLKGLIFMGDKNFKEKIKSLSMFLKEKGYELFSCSDAEKDFLLNCKILQDYEYVAFEKGKLKYTEKFYKMENLNLFYIEKDFLFNFKEEVAVILPLDTLFAPTFRISTKNGSFVLDEI